MADTLTTIERLSGGDIIPEATHNVPSIFYLFALFALLYLIFNLRKLTAVRIGKKEERPLNVFTQLGNFLIFGLAQGRVNSRQFTYATVMHFLLGWGFIELTFATTVDFFVARGWLVQFLPEMDTPWFAFVNDLGGLMLLVGTLMALYRRYVNKPEPLPQDSFKGRGNLLGDTGILLFILFLDLGGFITEAARLAIEQPATAWASWLGYPLSKALLLEQWQALKPYLWYSHALLSLLFISILPLTKMFHIIAVLINIAMTNKKQRGQIRSLHVTELMEDPEADFEAISLGASKATEFTWKQLLDSVACTECARCTSVCPAYVTDKPLSPMKLITDIRHNLYDNRFKRNDSVPLIGGVITEEELWSCTTCGACMEECPVLIDHVPTFTDMRRFLVLSEGKPPSQATKSLQVTSQAGNPWGLPAADRLKWAESAGLDVPIMADKKRADVLYWVGCAGAYDPRNQNISRAMIKILEAANIDYAVLGTEETCTGDSARRMGEEYLFETMVNRNIDILSQYSFDSILTACPHCFHTLGNEYPDFGSSYNVTHHTEFIEDLVSAGKLQIKNNLSKSITYHDPCYLGRHNIIFDAPRSIIRKVQKDDNLIEMPRSKKQSFCCGAGGGNMWYDIDKGERINLARFREAVNTGADIVATACSFCTIMMDDAAKVEDQEESVKVRDVAELVAESLTINES